MAGLPFLHLLHEAVSYVGVSCVCKPAIDALLAKNIISAQSTMLSELIEKFCKYSKYIRRKRSMNNSKISFKIGDSVRVKPDVLDPDTEAFSLEGWQGRILDIRPQEDGPTIIDIEWDSITLREMPASSIEACEEEGLDWTQMGLYPDDVEVTTARDTEQDVKHAQKELKLVLYKSYSWLGDEGKRIHQILSGVDDGDEMAAMKRWGAYLEEHLKFPFDAEVDEWQERGPLRSGDRVSVKNITLIDDLYGVIVALRLGRRKYDFPLCELAVIDKQSANTQLIQDYRVWFANR